MVEGLACHRIERQGQSVLLGFELIHRGIGPSYAFTRRCRMDFILPVPPAAATSTRPVQGRSVCQVMRAAVGSSLVSPFIKGLLRRKRMLS